MTHSTFHSNPTKQALLTIAVIIVGLILAIGFRNYDDSAFTNSLAGFLLGILLILIGIPGLITLGTETITIDTNTRCILIENVNRFRKKNKLIYFMEIAEVFVGCQGKRSSGTMSYYVCLRLNTGEVYNLFYPSYYDGRWDKSVAESRCNRIQEYIAQ